MMHLTFQRRPGGMLLLSVLMIGAVAMIIGTSMLLQAIDDADAVWSQVQAAKTQALADSCGEVALMNLAYNTNYSSDSLTLDSGTCTINVSGAKKAKTIAIVATRGTIVRKITLTADVSKTLIQSQTWVFNLQ